MLQLQRPTNEQGVVLQPWVFCFSGWLLLHLPPMQRPHRGHGFEIWSSSCISEFAAATGNAIFLLQVGHITNVHCVVAGECSSQCKSIRWSTAAGSIPQQTSLQASQKGGKACPWSPPIDISLAGEIACLTARLWRRQTPLHTHAHPL